MAKSTSTMYAIVAPSGQVNFPSIALYKKDCIANWIKGSSMSWSECKKYGWSCKKVEVTIEY